MEDSKPKLAGVITIISSIVVAIFSFFSHVNNLDSSRRAEIESMRDNFSERERILTDLFQRRYAEVVGHMSSNEARINAVEKTLDRLGALMAQEYGDLLLEQRLREDSKSKGENGE